MGGVRHLSQYLQTVLLTPHNQGWCLSSLFAFQFLDADPTFLESFDSQVLRVPFKETHITCLAVLSCSLISVACFIKWSTQLKQTVMSLITSFTDDGAETVSETVDTYFVFVWLTICEDIVA